MSPAVVWSASRNRLSFDEPTDSLLPGQKLILGQKPIPSFSEANWSESSAISLTVTRNGLFAQVETRPPQYLKLESDGQLRAYNWDSEWKGTDLMKSALGVLFSVGLQGLQDLLKRTMQLPSLPRSRSPLKDAWSVKGTIGRYEKGDVPIPPTVAELNIQVPPMLSKSSKLRRQIKEIQNSNRHILGESTSSLNFKELNSLEGRLEKAMSRVRSKKV
ncbi:hypothetical protein MLD38_020046 [Melastoma candidum]|uniref:Uncharacterized protein n=1 Tax=Melastoma candidum TaxID=119954 RepID=A0ACB9QBD0_9MYRT|nr:hypothetical protein MLD38_020046 [Melastoma candidum]